MLSLDKPIQNFQNEAGGHRIQRVPPTERQGRVHTSTVTCSVLDSLEPSQELPEPRKEDFHYRWFSGTGAGGQHRNKHQNCLELTHIPTGVVQVANGRSRTANERDAMAEILKQLTTKNQDANHNETNRIRSGQVGSGMRGDKRRTYRFQDDQVTDHQTGKSCSVKKFMKGNLELLW